ncbi:hypothetical protein C8J57DRAFT_1724858, partial [Mycena rebaudengoi]
MRPIANILTSFTFALAALANNRRPQEGHNGTVFYFEPGEGACGFINNATEHVGTVSMSFCNAFPGATANPNKNPICNRTLSIRVNNKTLNVKVVDCFQEDKDAGPNDIGITKMDFETLAPLRDGIIPNAMWSIV